MINMVIYLWQLDIQMVQFSIYGNLQKESLGIPWTNPQPWYVVVFHPHGFHPPHESAELLTEHVQPRFHGVLEGRTAACGHQQLGDGSNGLPAVHHGAL